MTSEIVVSSAAFAPLVDSKELERLKKDAREKYDTDDLNELRKLLDNMKAENERKRAAYQAELDRIEIHVVRYRQTHPVEDILPDALDAGPDLSPQITARPAARNGTSSRDATLRLRDAAIPAICPSATEIACPCPRAWVTTFA